MFRNKPVRFIKHNLTRFFRLQYYEMSYGLNVEMHKQVCNLVLMFSFSIMPAYSLKFVRSPWFVVLNFGERQRCFNSDNIALHCHSIHGD